MSSIMENSVADVLGRSYDDEVRQNFEKGRMLATCPAGDEVVISGISGVFPECSDMKEFEESLLAKKDLITGDERRWRHEIEKVPQRIGKVPVINKFDSLFFGMLDKQAEALDPMARILMEKTYEAIVDAGYNPRQIRGKNIGVFLGATGSDTETGVMSRCGETDLPMSPFRLPGVARSLLANRISYWLDITGPSYSMDTACSSSMYAIEQAYRAIRSGVCDAALVGGCNLCLHPAVSLSFAELGVLSPEGKCKCFDEAADGYVRSEGIVVCLLQKKKDSRRMYARIVHVKTNVDGYKEEGIHFPSSKIQSKLLNQVYAECGVDPANIKFMEAHATGTKVGDPAELMAIQSVFLNNRTEPLRIGSIKSNLGHTEPTSGLCSIAKMILSYETNLIMPNINFQTPRSDIESLQNGQLIVVTEPTPWNGGFTAVNSFGFGGANCHLVLDSNPKLKINDGRPDDDLPRLVVTSGRTEQAVDTILTDLESKPLDAEYVGLFHEIHKDPIPGHPYRGFTILKKDKTERVRTIEPISTVKKSIWYVYTGMGSQWATMGSALMKIPLFANSIHKSHKILGSKNIDLLNIITCNDAAIFNNVLNSYVGIVAIQIALTDLLSALNIVPDGIIGHSVGELCCGYADGCLTAEQTILLAYYRGLANESVKSIRGSMAAIGMGHEKLVATLPKEIDIACHNASENTTISGPAELVKKFVESLKNQGTFAVEVNSSNLALHSRYITNAGNEFQKFAKCVIPEPKERSSKWISSTFPLNEEESVDSKTVSDRYFLKNVLGTVYFAEACEKVPENAIVVEIAPHGLLQAILKRSLKNVANIPLTSKIHKDNSIHLLSAIGKLYTAGATPTISKLYPPIEFPVAKCTPMISHLIKWDHSKDWFVFKYAGETSIKNGSRTVRITLEKPENKYLAGHMIDGKNLYPATGYLALAWETLALLLGKQYTEFPVIFTNVELHMFTVLEEGSPLELTVAMHRNTGHFEIIHQGDLIASGTILELEDTHTSKIPPNYEALEKVSAEGDDPEMQPLLHDDVYRELRLRSYHCDSLFKGINSLSHNGRVAKIAWSNYVAFIDCLLKMRILFQKDQRKTVVPVRISRLVIDTKKHTEMLKNLDPVKPEFTAYLLEGNTEVHSGGIEVTGVEPRFFIRQKNVDSPIVAKYNFVPYNNPKLSNLKEAIRICAQIILDNSFGNAFRVIERVDEYTDQEDILIVEVLTEYSHESLFNLMMPSISLLMDTVSRLNEEKLVGLNADAGPIPTDNSYHLVVISYVLNRPEVLENCTKAVHEQGFILIREKPSTKTPIDKSIFDVCFDCIVEEKTRLILLRKKNVKQPNEPILVRITDDNSFKWLQDIKTYATADEVQKLVVFAEKETYNGLLGFYNCLSKEIGRENVKCFFIMDENAPPFSLQNPFYRAQYERNMSKNIFKQGEWGGYHHTTLDPVESIPTKHAYVNPLNYGDLTSLKWLEGPIDVDNYKPTPNKTLVHVYYASLNFRDIMLATKRLPVDFIFTKRLEQDATQGIEFVGRTNDGRRVMGTVDARSIASVVECDDNRLLYLPDDWSMEDGATAFTVYATVLHAFITCGKLKKGESVLIHSGAGGIGIAAIRICLHFDCQIFTTVGTTEKRDFIRKTFPQIPESHIGSSRDNSFMRMIFNETNGQGVALVLNSLSGEKLQLSVQCLSSAGRFLDVGKYDFINNNNLRMQQFLNEVSFHGIGLNEVFADRKRTLELSQLTDMYIKKKVALPLPRTVFGIDQIEEAYRFMGTGKHIGKVVIKIRDEEPNPRVTPQILTMNAYPKYYCNENSSYVICGGLGDLGLELADWLVVRGAKHVLLSSRRGLTSGYQASRIRIWKSYKAEIRIYKGDITSETDVKMMLETANSMGPVAAIFNLAGVLHDGLLENQSKDTFDVSVAPKVTATLLLDKLSRIMCPQLKQFVVFSSVSCGVGNSGQTNYGWSNSSMERICEKRRADNLPALAIQWGAIGEVGMYARMTKKKGEGIAGGVVAQDIKSCLDLMDQFLKQPNTIVLSMVVSKQDKSKSKEFKSLTEAVAHILGIKDIKSIDQEATLAELGLDSIMGVEIGQLIQNYDVPSLLPSTNIRNVTFKNLIKMEEEIKNKNKK